MGIQYFRPAGGLKYAFICTIGLLVFLYSGYTIVNLNILSHNSAEHVRNSVGLVTKPLLSRAKLSRVLPENV